MRKICMLFLMLAVLGFSSVPVFGGEIKTESAFELKDGYFQIGHGQPFHLICQSIGKQFLRLEDEFRLWLAWEIEEGKESPCPRRGENFCSEKLEIIGKDLDGKETVWNLWNWKDSKIDKDFSWSVPGYIPKKAAFGDAKIRVRITDKDGEKTYYSFEIPIEIR